MISGEYKGLSGFPGDLFESWGWKGASSIQIGPVINTHINSIHDIPLISNLMDLGTSTGLVKSWDLNESPQMREIITTGTKIASSVLSIGGTILSFTPLAPLGLALAGVGTGLGVVNAVATDQSNQKQVRTILSDDSKTATILQDQIRQINALSTNSAPVKAIGDTAQIPKVPNEPKTSSLPIVLGLGGVALLGSLLL